MNAPKISIIVAVFNGAITLQNCLDSVLNQKNAEYELIVIDGGSLDGTVDILRSYDNNLFQWVSEHDEGIYDAWNKGITFSHGQWVMFLGADDYLATENTLANLVTFISEFSQPFDYVTVRNVIIKAANSEKFWGRPWKWCQFRKYMSVCHVGALHHADLFKKYGLFDTKLKIAGDYELLLRAGNNLKTLDFPFNVAFCGEEGVSRTQIGKVCIESVKVQLRHHSTSLPFSLVRYGYAYLKYKFIKSIQIFL